MIFFYGIVKRIKFGIDILPISKCELFTKQPNFTVNKTHTHSWLVL